MSKWRSDNNGFEYLQNLFGSHKVSAFTEMIRDKKNPSLASRAHSF
jgi:hypothetical protein